MLTEEAFHMFVGTSGITRVIKRTLEVMKERGSDDPAVVRSAGTIDLPTLQRYINFWFSSALDLFGAEISSNAASYFATGVKGRPDEGRFEDHRAQGRLRLELPDGKGGVIPEEVPMRTAMNEVSRSAYVKDCDVGVQRWNRLIRDAGQDFRLALPSQRFRRSVGAWAGVFTDPQGNPITADAWRARQYDWLPSVEDRAFVRGLMQRVTEPGRVAGWIAGPEGGINNLPIPYEYVRLQ
jgi:benzoyl-CoA 2,3-epoxidase subunit B